ncbi:hypothetical protein ACFYVL_04675 [Streptomyces sp. NPDC004111]|uniref:DUF7144 family membrane protein n=1 Tax=Streptomyces sp. NPDC004111 TaxID=3364690 RepID=UPI0036B665B6
MAEQFAPGPPRPGAPPPEQEPRVSTLTVGGVVFAACVLGIIGAFHVIAGLSAILSENYYQAQNAYSYDLDVNTRGWVEMITGIVVLAAALSLFSGRTWARAVCIAVTALSAMENFFFTPYHPVWSALIIVLDVAVIWAIATYGRRQAHKVYGAPM